MKKIISVTADDIKAGERTNRFKCPVARAIQRQTRKKFVSVAFRYVCIDGVLYRLPKRVTNFIYGFDGITPAFRSQAVHVQDWHAEEINLMNFRTRTECSA